MSIYAQAIQGGMSSLQLALTGGNAATDAAYDAEYNRAMQSIAAGNAKVSAEANISAIKQDSVTSSLKVQMQQTQAEANAKVAAAVSGAEGSSVDQGIYQTKANAAYAQSDIQKRENAAIEGELANVNNAQMAMLSAENSKQKFSTVGAVLGTLSSLEMKDFATAEALGSGGTQLYVEPPKEADALGAVDPMQAALMRGYA